MMVYAMDLKEKQEPLTPKVRESSGSDMLWHDVGALLPKIKGHCITIQDYSVITFHHVMKYYNRDRTGV